MWILSRGAYPGLSGGPKCNRMVATQAGREKGDRDWRGWGCYQQLGEWQILPWNVCRELDPTHTFLSGVWPAEL